METVGAAASATAPPTRELATFRANSVAGDAIPQPQAEAAALKRDAVAAAKRVAEAYPDDALAYALLGSAYHNIGQSDEAKKQLGRCIELNPTLTEAYVVLARIAYDRGQTAESARLCEQALKHGPASAEVLNRWGRALMDLGRTSEAVQALDRAAQLPEPPSETFYLLGQAQLQSGNYDRAKDSFLRATALLSDHTQAFFGLFTACLRLGQIDEASRYRAQFEKLEALDRRSLTDRSAQEDTLTGLPLVRRTVARTFFGAAQIYSAHDQVGAAGDLLRQSASLDPDNLMYRAAIEAHYTRRQALAEGVAVFEQLAVEQPTNSLNFLFLGRLASRRQQYEAAEAAYRKVQELNPKWAEGYRALAELNLRANRKLGEALPMARQAAELEANGAHFYLLGILCLRNGDRAGALAAAKQAVTLSPNEEEYREFLRHLQAAP